MRTEGKSMNWRRIGGLLALAAALAGENYEIRAYGYDEKGEKMVPGIRISDGSGQLHRLDPEEPRYFPTELAKAADEQFHDPNGSVGFFVLALVMLIYAWCGFRYEAFQRFMFHMSPSNLMIDNPEPSDFYFFMCKAAGIFGMDSRCGYFFSGIMTKKARFRHGSAPSKTGFFNRF